jgi:hypothetical protein
MRQPRNRVTLLAVLSLALGLISLYGGAVLMLGGSVAGVLGSTDGVAVMALGATMFALGPASFVLGFGFWGARPWAWSAAFAVLGVSLIVDVASVAVGASLGTVAVSAALAVAVMLYLRTPEARQALKRPVVSKQVAVKA